MLETRSGHDVETGRVAADSQIDHVAPCRSDEPVIAVVIPVYKQSGYLQDAVLSVLKQSMRPFVRIVIVNDGCPYSSTDELARLFSSQFPGEVFYLRKENGGLSSARNHGIRFALDAWPSIQAILPLDADNRLSPHTLEQLWQALEGAAHDTGWVYHDLTIFGSEESAWRTGIPFSVYRLLHENFCDAGSLVHRRVFDSNIWYDEDMKVGYEDWELYIRASLSGLRGFHTSDTGFLYRVHGHSMLTNTQQRHREVHDSIVRKHARQLRPASLVQLEHDELPRFAIVELDADRVRWTTNPCDADQSTMSIAAFRDSMADWDSERRPKSGYIPPMTIFSTNGVIDRMDRLHILPGILFGMQSLCARHDSAYLNIQDAESPYFLGLSRADSPDRPALLAIPTRRLIEVGSRQNNRMPHLARGTEGFRRAGFALQIGLAHTVHVDGLRHDRLGGQTSSDVLDPSIEVLEDISAKLRASSASTGRPESDKIDAIIASHTHFAAQHQLDKGSAAFPYFARERDNSNRRSIWFTAPWIRLGGVDQIVLNLARQIAKSDTAYDVHLLVTDASEIDADPRALDPFQTVTFLATGENRDEQQLIDILAGADIVFNAHSRATYNALPRLRASSSAPIVSLLQVIDPDRFGVPRGYPVLSSRQYEGLIDHFVVPSRRLKRTCVNLGVPEDKVLVVPNAPVVHPPSLDLALDLVQEKARRPYSAERPLRILFAGRFDDQKGYDRLKPIHDSLRDLGVPFVFTVIGKAVLSRVDLTEALPGATILPPAQDPATLARYYSEADVFLLPSRWEGVPLSMLEAMSFGGLVVATNVGAIDEVVEDGVNGFLIDPGSPEEEIVAAISSRIAAIGSQAIGCDHVREAAVRTAMSFTWHDAAKHLTALVETTRESEA